MTEIRRLIPFLLEHKRSEDEIVILFDKKNGDPLILEFLLPFNGLHNMVVFSGEFIDNFADWKNILNGYCSGDYIYQIDADEMISEYIINNLHQILSMNSDVDLIFVPRINTVNGITQEHIDKWRWNVNDKGYVNFPDRQGRIYKKGMGWYGKVHERIIGGNKFSSLPEDEEYCIQHHKTIDRQEKQNKFYQSI